MCHEIVLSQVGAEIDGFVHKSSHSYVLHEGVWMYHAYLDIHERICVKSCCFGLYYVRLSLVAMPFRYHNLFADRCQQALTETSRITQQRPQHTWFLHGKWFVVDDGCKIYEGNFWARWDQALPMQWHDTNWLVGAVSSGLGCAFQERSKELPGVANQMIRNSTRIPPLIGGVSVDFSGASLKGDTSLQMWCGIVWKKCCAHLSPKKCIQTSLFFPAKLSVSPAANQFFHRGLCFWSLLVQHFTMIKQI